MIPSCSSTIWLLKDLTSLTTLWHWGHFLKPVLPSCIRLWSRNRFFLVVVNPHKSHWSTETGTGTWIIYFPDVNMRTQSLPSALVQSFTWYCKTLSLGWTCSHFGQTNLTSAACVGRWAKYSWTVEKSDLHFWQEVTPLKASTTWGLMCSNNDFDPEKLTCAFNHYHSKCNHCRIIRMTKRK